jgi:two-component system chemotaxis response regulator CheB
MTPQQPSNPNPAPGAIRILVVDDSAFMRKALTQIFSTDPDLVVIDTARNGQDGVDKCKALKPDVVTLDVEMPVLNGLEMLARIKAECFPCPSVLMCSSLTQEGSRTSLEALRLGAADVIGKPSGSISLDIAQLSTELIAKIKAIAGTRALRASLASRALNTATRTGDTATRTGDNGARTVESGARRPTGGPGAHLSHLAAALGVSVPPIKTIALTRDRFQILVIGSSTGGPPVLETIITQLPERYPMPVVVAQHMPVLFTRSLAERLNQQSHLPVVHGEHGMSVEPGTVYIAPGGQHTRVVRQPGGSGRLALEISPDPVSAVYRPSVNELFASATACIGSRTLAVMCTGMGDDGVVGSRELKAQGGVLLAQNAESCVVYGMPRAVIQENLADAIAPPEDLARMVASLGGGQVASTSPRASAA